MDTFMSEIGRSIWRSGHMTIFVCPVMLHVFRRRRVLCPPSRSSRSFLGIGNYSRVVPLSFCASKLFRRLIALLMSLTQSKISLSPFMDEDKGLVCPMPFTLPLPPSDLAHVFPHHVPLSPFFSTRAPQPRTARVPRATPF